MYQNCYGYSHGIMSPSSVGVQSNELPLREICTFLIFNMEYRIGRQKTLCISTVQSVYWSPLTGSGHIVMHADTHTHTRKQSHANAGAHTQSKQCGNECCPHNGVVMRARIYSDKGRQWRPGVCLCKCVHVRFHASLRVCVFVHSGLCMCAFLNVCLRACMCEALSRDLTWYRGQDQ